MTADGAAAAAMDTLLDAIAIDTGDASSSWGIADMVVPVGKLLQLDLSADATHTVRHRLHLLSSPLSFFITA